MLKKLMLMATLTLFTVTGAHANTADIPAKAGEAVKNTMHDMTKQPAKAGEAVKNTMHDMTKQPATTEVVPAHVQEYTKAMDLMHEPMMKGVADPDPDTAFVKGMIPHHEGAVAMAKTELAHGKDPELKKLAQAIIDSQAVEIEFMNKWLEKKAALKP